jgi:site-specific DNA-adenine methylase
MKSMHEFVVFNKAYGLGLYKINSKGNLNFEMPSIKLKKTIKSRKIKSHIEKARMGWVRVVCEIIKIKGNF